MANAKVDFYRQDVRLAVRGATEAALIGLAYQIEGEAKVGAPVDTGFHRNAIYVVHRRGGAAPPPSGTQYSKKAGRTVKRVAAPKVTLPPDVAAAVHAAASYAIFVEMHMPHIYPAAQRVAKRAAGQIEAVGRGRL